MGIIRPATPGFLITLAATILLAVVSFCVPLLRSIYFLKASLVVEKVNGYITFGTLGYCLNISGTTTCSNATVGYELNINQLVGNNLPIQIPDVVVKWLTYALVLHIVAFALSALSALLGLLAHIREMAMTCFSSCFAGFAAAVALVAFIFDIALFFIAKSRLNSVSGGSAQIGNAVWITLAAWILLFFSGCFYAIGRCCVNRRPRGNKWDGRDQAGASDTNTHADQMRLGAVKAEADRKARQGQGEVGLPAFQEYEPLKASVSGDEAYADEEERVPYHDNHNGEMPGSYGRQPSTTGYAPGGYGQAPAGSSAMDEYNNPTYPPQPQHHGSSHTQTTSGYAPSYYAYAAGNTTMAAAVVAAERQQYPMLNTYHNPEPYSAQTSPTGTTIYNDPLSQQYGIGQEYDPYNHHPQTLRQELSFNPDTCNSSGAMYGASNQSSHASSSNAYAPSPSPVHQGHTSYTLGGGGYGRSAIPAISSPPEAQQSSYFPCSHGLSPMLTKFASGEQSTSPVKGPRSPHIVIGSPVHQRSGESLPGYEVSPSQPPKQR